MENFETHQGREYVSRKEAEPLAAPETSENQDDLWAELQQYAAKEVPKEDDILSVEQLSAMPEGESILALRMEAVRQLKGFERIKAIGGIEKYLDDSEEKWQGKRGAMDAQSSRKIDELGGVVGKIQRLVSTSKRNVWTTANEISQAIKIVDDYRAKKKALLDRKKSN